MIHSLLILTLLASAGAVARPIAPTQTDEEVSVGKSDDSPSVQAESEPSGDEFEPTRVLAIVGGEPIFVGDMLFEVNQLITRFMPDAPDSVVQRERSGLVRKMLPKYIEQKLMLIDVKRGLPAEANFEDIVDSASKEFDDKALEGMMESAGVKSPTMFDAHLRAQGSSLRKLRLSWTTNQIVSYFLQQKLTSDIEISHQELLQYYREHETDYALKARARWEQVMVQRDKFATEDEAMSAIVEMGNKIVYGASLSGVAKKSSHGFRAHEGGQHDWTNQGSLLLKELDEAIFSLPIGQLSDVIKTPRGFHIVRVLEREAAGKVAFVDAQSEIRKTLETERRVTAFEDYLGKLKKEIPVEILDGPERSARSTDAVTNLKR